MKAGKLGFGLIVVIVVLAIIVVATPLLSTSKVHPANAFPKLSANTFEGFDSKVNYSSRRSKREDNTRMMRRTWETNIKDLKMKKTRDCSILSYKENRPKLLDSRNKEISLKLHKFSASSKFELLRTHI